MRTLTPVKGVLTAAACAMALLPAGAAQAGDSAGPTSSSAGNVTASTADPRMAPADSDEEEASSRMAHPRHVCSDAHQIGSTGHIKYRGHIAASVKQFYSKKCNRNYGYLYIWKSFRKHHPRYSINIAVYDFKTKKLVGLRRLDHTSVKSLWSYPANTVRHCTAARGALKVPGDNKQYHAYSSKRC
jgi:hypothetical protein